MAASEAPPTASGWSQTERAALQSLRSQLQHRGAVFEYTEGTTDEDDPWATYSRPSGTVILHIEKLGGRYAAFGDDFGELRFGRIEDIAEKLL